MGDLATSLSNEWCLNPLHCFHHFLRCCSNLMWARRGIRQMVLPSLSGATTYPVVTFVLPKPMWCHALDVISVFVGAVNVEARNTEYVACVLGNHVTHVVS